ncbi:MAG: 2-oxoacid:ferredoxin oxidoreductase subunit gamma [Theionarchaea archaeon]|nr:2-oxoacid:ferredoxin oxidoreductase subunit gamma [Theionarchaea archaeon]MBU7000772.1 2-oxoacid:ferredoxin oxidoreductase subunit gamma [Theionarchaea archaeon]MBU7021445.1 2-oxoacid:ferredoxin oxidoreductase subunit gamma [Theionarchaea archaeon]MBU7033614.1 2-oxoacid:ferredoxin oxidoreductase subunit gamma [Theionarchaea archaeon]MBU7040736.1 2-oxoacid:ferredoxin oxidoreductase subunit gamma [Theionarchaea archaeon]
MRKEIRVCGFGGQGIVLAGMILGKAASVYSDYYSVQTQSYGPEARGGASRSEVIISDEPIAFPGVMEADILVAMSQPAFDKYTDDLKKDATIIVDPSLVIDTGKFDPIRIEFTALAEDLGRKIVANIIMLGSLTRLTSVVTEEAMQKAVFDSVPPRTIDLNKKALEVGFKAADDARAALTK